VPCHTEPSHSSRRPRVPCATGRSHSSHRQMRAFQTTVLECWPRALCLLSTVSGERIKVRGQLSTSKKIIAFISPAAPDPRSISNKPGSA
jgi:hypothetical protein